MIRHVIFLVCRDGDPAEERRIARIANSLNEMGVTVKHHDEAKLPCINVGTTGHTHHGRVNILPLNALRFVLSREFFPEISTHAGLPIPVINKTGLKGNRDIREQKHKHEIVRTGLTMRVTKKSRKQRFR